MKIGIVCYPTVGGSGVVATELGHQLALRGHEVHFISYETPFRLQACKENIFFHKVEIFQYNLFQYPDYALPLAVKMAEIASAYHLDVFHVHYAIPHATSAFLAREILGGYSPAIITTLHGTDITLVGKEKSYRQIVKLSIEKSDRVTAVSSNLCKQTNKIFEPTIPIEHIPNCFAPKSDIADQAALIRRRYLKEGERLLVHASNYRAVKRPQDLLSIFHIINEKIPSKLLLVGSGEGLDYIKESLKNSFLSEKVIFVGEHAEIDRFVAAADLFLLPSQQESFGLVALEAMAYGTPVLANNVGGVAELIENGKSGFLSEAGDINQMGQNGCFLLSSDEEYSKVSEGALERAKQFSIDAIVPKYEKLYTEAIEKEGVFSGTV